MATVNKVLFEGKFAETTDTLQYESTSVTTIIDKFTACNISGAPATLTINLLQPSGSAANDNRIVAKTIPAGATYTFPEVVGHNLEAGGGISTKSSIAGALAIRASGRQIS